MRRSGRSFAHSPKRCEQGSVTPNGRPVYPATCLPHHSPPLRSALRTASSILQTPETTCNSWTEDKGDQEAEMVHWFRAQCVVVAESWITNTELSSWGRLQWDNPPCAPTWPLTATFTKSCSHTVGHVQQHSNSSPMNQTWLNSKQ